MNKEKVDCLIELLEFRIETCEADKMRYELGGGAFELMTNGLENQIKAYKTALNDIQKLINE